MIPWFYRTLLIPAYESGLKRRRTFRYWRDLESSQWLSTAELQEKQVHSLRNLLHHAAAHCLYYAERWSQLGLNPRDITSVAELERWPFVDRAAIREHRFRMRSMAPGQKLIPKATGGSSGVPLQFDFTPESNDRRMAAWHRGYSWAGAAPGTRQVYLWGVALGGGSPRDRWKDHLYSRWLYRRHVLNTFDLNEDTMPRYLQEFNRVRPTVLVAYTNPLYLFARWLEERKLVPFSPRSIVVGAEKLHDFQRTLIERVFQAPLFETYGSREFMLIGAECEHHAGLHLTTEHLVVEIVDDDGRPVAPGQEGNIAVTDLYNYGMPFIRYLTGDRAIAGFNSCKCGRGLPLLRQVVGRQLDVLISPSGRLIPGEFFPHLMKEFPAVRQFQVVQSDPDEIVLKLVVGADWSSAERNRLFGQVQQQLGDDLRLAICEADRIPLTPAGKLQVVVNHLASRSATAANTALMDN